MSDESNYVRAMVFANTYVGMVFRLSPQELKQGWAYYHATRHAESAAKHYEAQFPGAAPAQVVQPQAPSPPANTVVVDMRKVPDPEDSGGVLGKIDPAKEQQLQAEFLQQARAARGE